MRQIFGRHERNSGVIARNRLKLILAADQLNCRPGILELIRDDMIGVLSRYAEFDPVLVDISLDRQSVLSARIPIRQLHNLRNE